ncbi:peptidylprolyl isomerase [Thermodesulfobacteriota bacterium]
MQLINSTGIGVIRQASGFKEQGRLLIEKRKNMTLKSIFTDLMAASLLMLMMLGLTGAGEAFPDTGSGVATVNGKAVTRVEYENNLNFMKQMYQQRGMPLNDKVVEEIKKRAIDSLIEQELLFQESLKAKVQVEKSAVEKQLSVFKHRFPSEEAFKKAMNDRKLSEDTLIEQIERGLSINTFIEQRIVSNIKVTKAETERFYETNPNLFRKSETVKASHILIKLEDSADKSRKAEADNKIAKIQQKLRDGQNFGDLARRFSEGPSRSNGGDLGYFKRGQMVPPFEKAAFALKPGEISGKVVTQFGYHLIKVIDKKAGGAVSYKEAKEKISGHLKEVKTKEEVKRYLQTLKDTAEIKYLQ